MFNVKKILLNLIISAVVCFITSAAAVFAEDNLTLKAGVSLAEQIPVGFMGTWRVSAKLKTTDSPQNFKQTSVDIWNLSKKGDVINLSNPFNGASASVRVDYVEGNLIRFTKVGNYDNKKLTDTVDLKLNGNTFTGINTLVLETFSTYDNSLIYKDTALYILKGEKISGSTITGK